jgi:hypothetical protein
MAWVRINYDAFRYFVRKASVQDDNPITESARRAVEDTRELGSTRFRGNNLRVFEETIFVWRVTVWLYTVHGNGMERDHSTLWYINNPGLARC